VPVLQEAIYNMKINLFDPYYQIGMILIRVLLMENKIIQFGRISTQKNEHQLNALSLFNQLAMENLFGMEVGSEERKGTLCSTDLIICSLLINSIKAIK